MQNSIQRRNGFGLSPRWLLVGLLVLVSIALFPYGLLPFGRLFRVFPGLRHVAQHVYSSWEVHVFGHAMIFVVIGTAVLLCFPSLLSRPKIYLSLMFVLGFLQEFFQIVGFKHRAVLFDDFFDVFVDLTGAVAAFLLMRLLWKLWQASPLANKRLLR